MFNIDADPCQGLFLLSSMPSYEWALSRHTCPKLGKAPPDCSRKTQHKGGLVQMSFLQPLMLRSLHFLRLNTQTQLPREWRFKANVLHVVNL